MAVHKSGFDVNLGSVTRADDYVAIAVWFVRLFRFDKCNSISVMAPSSNACDSLARVLVTFLGLHFRRLHYANDCRVGAV